MRTLEEKIETKAPSSTVWKAWKDLYKKNVDKSGFSVGKKAYIAPQKGSAIPFIIHDIREGQSFTTVWRTYFVRFIFQYQVEKASKGSIIRCKVLFRGLFSYPFVLLLKRRIRKYVKSSLEQFKNQIEDVKKY